MGCCEKKGIGSVFLQRGVFLVQRFLALEVGLDASVACADLLVGVHMRHLVHVVLLDSLEQVRADEGGVHALDGDVAVEQAAVIRSLLFIAELKDSPTTRVLIHEKSSLAPPGQSLAFSLGDEKGFEWIGAYDITADELLAGTDTAKTESKTAQAQMLILELLADGKRMPSAELEKAVNERGISSRTMRTAKSRIGDRLVTEKDGTAWVCYLRD